LLIQRVELRVDRSEWWARHSTEFERRTKSRVLVENDSGHYFLSHIRKKLQGGVVNWFRGAAFRACQSLQALTGRDHLIRPFRGDRSRGVGDQERADAEGLGDILRGGTMLGPGEAGEPVSQDSL
jgi:hypothetical protein